MEDRRIKTTILLKGEFIDQIDRRSEQGALFKYEQIESDLDAYWSLLSAGMANVREVLDDAELTFVIKLIRGRKILGQDILLWAHSGLEEYARQAFRRYSQWEMVGVTEASFLDRLEQLDVLERIALCDWAQRQWPAYCNERAHGQALPFQAY